ncbi:MAG TPA: hypothetical protein VIV60_13250 [Polyangiaceae bacterium]
MRSALLKHGAPLVLALNGSCKPQAQSNSPPSAPTSPAVSAEAAPATDVAAKLRNALNSAARTPEERQRDQYRHPFETLSFFGIAPNSRVVELSAGRGWYTAILGPFLNPDGKLTVTTSDPNGPADSEGTKNARYLTERLTRDPAHFARVTPVVIDWKDPSAALGNAGSADLVLTFRNIHGWINDQVFDRVLTASFRVLKSGGTLGIVEHRANPSTSIDPKTIGDTGYVPEAYVIERCRAAGFALMNRSEVNANPKDEKNYPAGVWTLPPTLRLGEVDRTRYLAIGESDRMTLKFTKP